jgi:uncharacterized integral membrane protein
MAATINSVVEILRFAGADGSWTSCVIGRHDTSSSVADEAERTRHTPTIGVFRRTIRKVGWKKTRTGGTVGDNDRNFTDAGDDTKAPIAMVVAGLIVIGVAIFVAQNTEDVTFEFLWFNFTWPLWLVLVIVFVLGALAGQGAMWWRRRRRRNRD